MGSPKVLVTLENTDLVVMSGRNMSSNAALAFPRGGIRQWWGGRVSVLAAAHPHGVQVHFTCSGEGKLGTAGVAVKTHNTRTRPAK